MNAEDTHLDDQYERRIATILDALQQATGPIEMALASSWYGSMRCRVTLQEAERLLRHERYSPFWFEAVLHNDGTVWLDINSDADQGTGVRYLRS